VGGRVSAFRRKEDGTHEISLTETLTVTCDGEVHFRPEFSEIWGSENDPIDGGASAESGEQPLAKPSCKRMPFRYAGTSNITRNMKWIVPGGVGVGPDLRRLVPGGRPGRSEHHRG